MTLDLDISGPQTFLWIYTGFFIVFLIGLIVCALRAGYWCDQKHEGKMGGFIAAAIACGIITVASGGMSLSIAWELFKTTLEASKGISG